jgi:uncharacterized membrane protein
MRVGQFLVLFGWEAADKFVRTLQDNRQICRRSGTENFSQTLTLTQIFKSADKFVGSL